MSRLAWLLQRRGNTLVLALGVALVALTLIVHHALVRPLAVRVEAQQAERAGGREQRVERLDDALARAASPTSQLAAFHAHFTHDPPLTDRLVRLHGIAAEQGLEIEQAEYRLTQSPDSRLDRYQMVLPLVAPYPKVRAFVGEALREMPTLSLDAIRLQRPDVADGTARAQITFTLFVAR
jgi:hypothetical protein